MYLFRDIIPEYCVRKMKPRQHFQKTLERKRVNVSHEIFGIEIQYDHASRSLYRP